ncbi:MAG: acetate--CoA ligase family protein [Candidatus Bathyarchaeia archaeon]
MKPWKGWMRLEAKEALDRILMPESIAVVGASKDPFKWGHMLLSAIMKGGFEGRIYPINPRETEIEGLPCYPTVRDVPGDIDMALVVVPARVVPTIFSDLAEKGVRGAVVITSGFGEAGEEGLRLVEQMRANAAGRVRFVGPNCMGVCSSPAKLSALMIPFLHERGEVAFVSQSGGYGLQLYLRASAMGVGIHKFVSSGNESDLTSVDYLRYFGDDPSVRLICMYIEGLKRGREWYEAAKEITRRKPVVVIKVGTTEEGGKAAASHTGALSGSDKIYDAAFRQAGVIRARDAVEMFDLIKGLLYLPLPRGDRIGIVSNSGGIAVETADALIRNGLKVPPLSEEAQGEILKVIPAFGNPRNPVDLTASLNMNSFLRVPDIVLSQGNIDGLVTIGLGTSLLRTMFPDVAAEDLKGIYRWINEQLIAIYKKYEKPVVVINPAADIEPEATKVMEEARIPVYTTPERAADVMGVLYRRKLYLDKVESE